MVWGEEVSCEVESKLEPRSGDVPVGVEFVLELGLGEVVTSVNGVASLLGETVTVGVESVF